MAKEKRSSTINKLYIGRKLSLEEVEEALCAATRKTSMAARRNTEGVELARVDILKDETLVFFRGDKVVADGLKIIFRKKSPKIKLKVTKTTAAALAKAL